MWYWDKDNYRAQWNKTENPEINCDIMVNRWRKDWSFHQIVCVCVLVYVLSTSNVFIWRRRWHPTPVLLPGKSHG